MRRWQVKCFRNCLTSYQLHNCCNKIMVNQTGNRVITQLILLNIPERGFLHCNKISGKKKNLVRKGWLYLIIQRVVSYVTQGPTAGSLYQVRGQLFRHKRWEGNFIGTPLSDSSAAISDSLKSFMCTGLNYKFHTLKFSIFIIIFRLLLLFFKITPGKNWNSKIQILSSKNIFSNF